MLTAKDLYKHIEHRDTVRYEKEIDTWLQEEVFPKFEGNRSQFIIPKSIPQDILKVGLQTRGFMITFNVKDLHSPYENYFITLAIAPQGM